MACVHAGLGGQGAAAAGGGSGHCISAAPGAAAGGCHARRAARPLGDRAASRLQVPRYALSCCHDSTLTCAELHGHQHVLAAHLYLQ